MAKNKKPAKGPTIGYAEIQTKYDRDTAPEAPYKAEAAAAEPDDHEEALQR